MRRIGGAPVRRARAGRGPRRSPGPSLVKALEPGGSHQAGDTLSRQAVALEAELGPDPGGAVGPPRIGVDLADLLDQRAIVELAARRRPAAPGVETRARHTEHSAHQRHGIVRPLRRDEPVGAHRSSLSRAKKATAFFRISRSCSSARTRRRSWRTSWVLTSSLAFWSSWRIQLRTVWWDTPSCAPIARSELPSSRKSRRASTRSSSGYANGFSTGPPSLTEVVSVRVSVQPGQVQGELVADRVTDAPRGIVAARPNPFRGTTFSPSDTLPMLPS